MIAAATQAGATLPTYVSTTWKNVDTEPGGVCGYAQGLADGQQPGTGQDYYVAYGQNYYRDQSPCAPGAPTSGQDAAALKVQVSMDCSYTDDNGTRTGTSTIWTGAVKSNVQGAGSIAGGLLWSDWNINNCFSTTLTPWIRTTVKSWYNTAFGYVEVDHTTSWVDPCKFH